MEIKDLTPISWANQPVLVSKQVAQVYGTSTERISHNFSENKEQFKEGLHYFKLTGAALREFKKEWGFSTSAPPPFSKMANCLYLWTKQGCARHCKMLNTPEAWQVFDVLEKNYFNVAAAPALPAPQAAPAIINEEVNTLTARFQNQFAKPCTNLAVVYALLMSNGTVKIGMTKDLPDRIKQIQGETGLKAWDYRTTPFMSRDDAAALEQFLLEKFAPYAMGGEFFDVKFTLVAAEL